MADPVIYPPGFSGSMFNDGTRAATAHFRDASGAHLRHELRGTENLPDDRWQAYLDEKHAGFVAEGYTMMTQDEVLASWADLASKGILA